MMLLSQIRHAADKTSPYYLSLAAHEYKHEHANTNGQRMKRDGYNNNSELAVVSQFLF